MIKIIILLTLAIMPSPVKVLILRLRGAKIGKNVKIGLAIINSENIEIGDNVVIGHFNLLWRLKNLQLQSGCAIVGFNWITGATSGSFFVGQNTGITRFHFFESSGDISIGSNTIVAGRGSTFFTHGISSVNLDDIRSITIGDWCYVGSGSKFVPGSGVNTGTFVGMGAVVHKAFTEEYILAAGCPAQIKSRLSQNDTYFNRTHLPQAHHPSDYPALEL